MGKKKKRKGRDTKCFTMEKALWPFSGYAKKRRRLLMAVTPSGISPDGNPTKDTSPNRRSVCAALYFYCFLAHWRFDLMAVGCFVRLLSDRFASAVAARHTAQDT